MNIINLKYWSLILIFVLTIVLTLGATAYIQYEEDEVEQINEEKLKLQFFENINQERSMEEKSELEYNVSISEVALYKSQLMYDYDYISHDSPKGEDVRDRFNNYNVMHCKSVGENLAHTYYNKEFQSDSNNNQIQKYTTQEELADGITEQFMNSPAHKENLLRSEWDETGIGIIYQDQKVYVTQKFCKSDNK